MAMSSGGVLRWFEIPAADVGAIVGLLSPH